MSVGLGWHEALRPLVVGAALQRALRPWRGGLRDKQIVSALRLTISLLNNEAE